MYTDYTDYCDYCDYSDSDYSCGYYNYFVVNYLNFIIIVWYSTCNIAICARELPQCHHSHYKLFSIPCSIFLNVFQKSALKSPPIFIKFSYTY